MRFGMVAAAAAALVCAGQADAQMTTINEVEPNDTLATAQFVPVALFKPYEIRGFLEGDSAGFVDYFRVMTGSLACTAGKPTCYTLSFSATGDNGNQPLISVFNTDGTPLFNGASFDRGSFETDMTDTSYIVALRRNTITPATSYSLFASLSYSYAPEPATWAMMIVGLGMVGYGLRRRRAKVAFA